MDRQLPPPAHWFMSQAAHYNQTYDCSHPAALQHPVHPLPRHSNNNTAPHHSSIETFFGFIKDRLDGFLLIEACIAGELKPLQSVPLHINIRSGTCIVFAEDVTHNQSRWRDGKRWSASRINGPFLLYREIEPSNLGTRKVTPKTESSYSRFDTTSFRPNTRMALNGLAKRTVSLIGSDYNRYRVINYFYPADVEHFFDSKTTETSALTLPSKDSRLQRYLHRIRAPIPPNKQDPGLFCSQQKVRGRSVSLFSHEEDLIILGSGAEAAVAPSVESETVLYHIQKQTSFYTFGNQCPCGGIVPLKSWEFQWLNPRHLTQPIVLAPLWKTQT
ncbi:Gti1/Pac2 family-domain-containing protein [Obelidium mucronatum]|nr:Gti1/Pac2 family-domain-containing protein [Obelidium mucronatum]